MIETYFSRFVDRAFEWISSSGLQIMLITVGMLLLFSLLHRVMERFRRLYEGRLFGPTELKRADTLTQVIRDLARVVILGSGGNDGALGGRSGFETPAGRGSVGWISLSVSAPKV